MLRPGLRYGGVRSSSHAEPAHEGLGAFGGDFAVSRREDESRFQDLYQKYSRSVVAFFVRQGFSRDEARDLAQDTFVRVYRGMGGYRGDGAWSFLETTARRIAINEIRSRMTQMRSAAVTSLDDPQTQTVSQDPWTGAPPLSPETELVEQQEAARRRKRLQQAIASLPDRLRGCLLLWLQGLSYREITVTLRLSLDAVKSRLNEARNQLREQLGEEPEGLAWPREGPAGDDDDRKD